MSTQESFSKISQGYCQYPCGLAETCLFWTDSWKPGNMPWCVSDGKSCLQRPSQLHPRCLNSKACVTVRGVKQPANKTDVATALAGVARHQRVGFLENMFVSLPCVVFSQWWHFCILLCGCSSVCWWWWVFRNKVFHGKQEHRFCCCCPAAVHVFFCM